MKVKVNVPKMETIEVLKGHKPKIGRNGMVEVWVLNIKCFDGELATSLYTSFNKVVTEIKRCFNFSKVEFTDEHLKELKVQRMTTDGKDNYLVECLEVW